ncbi:hypothetical protein wTpre_869 [Wolbachia endosymbiont of Trichogramma pretiosum]|nr:hypothetical protein wTpre_869 [Wolbachia endosymbiont of Trichogramma pretiosum]
MLAPIEMAYTDWYEAVTFLYFTICHNMVVPPQVTYHLI